MDENVVERVALVLQSPPRLEVLGQDEAASETVSLERMSMIDFVESLGRRRVTEESAERAVSVLHDLIVADLPRTLNDVQKAAMVAEKYDALVSLTRIEPNLGAEAIRRIGTPAAQEVLYPALLTGLVDRGIAREHVEKFAQGVLAYKLRSSVPAQVPGLQKRAVKG